MKIEVHYHFGMPSRKTYSSISWSPKLNWCHIASWFPNKYCSNQQQIGTLANSNDKLLPSENGSVLWNFYLNDFFFTLVILCFFTYNTLSNFFVNLFVYSCQYIADLALHFVFSTPRYDLCNCSRMYLRIDIGMTIHLCIWFHQLLIILLWMTKSI